MYCSNCGNKMENGDKFCRFCGKEIIYNQTNNNNISNDIDNNINSNMNNISNNVNDDVNNISNNINGVNNNKVEETTNNKIEDKIFNYGNKLKRKYLELLFNFKGAVSLHYILIVVYMFSNVPQDLLVPESPENFLLFLPLFAAIWSIPFYAVYYVSPQIIGGIIEWIYKRKPKKILLILMFIASVLSLISIIKFSVSWFIDWKSLAITTILIIHSCLLIIHYFYKLRNEK